MEKYKERIVDRLLSEKLEGMGAVLIEGPKWCGKTTTAEHALPDAHQFHHPPLRDGRHRVQGRGVKK